MKEYKHLSAEERAAIMIERAKNTSVRAIARLLGRSASTITRELARNHTESPCSYDATSAARAYRTRRERSRRQHKLAVGSALYWQVHHHLVYRRWSPQQIAARLREMHPDTPEQRVSHETIYAAIYTHPRGGLKQAMIEALRQEKPARGNPRKTLARKSFVPEELRIIHRPEQIETRKWPGHWEGDLVKGAFNRSCVGTLVERKTRFVVLCRMDGCTAEDALEGFTRQMKKLPAFLRESLTYDRGSEMTCHVELAERLNLDIWFADPYAPWQRGSNENTNGLLRQFLPKGMDLSDVTQMQLNDIAKLLNGRPRQTLGWKTPEEAMAVELAAAGLAKRCT
ncbi:IS30 family transposase [Burkholderia ubonensis]|uniref:IS30 family transposase n=1 Tax=Burkholderia ubonensis TaxID=101571 RepID=UPI0009B43CF9|nr:IS30 family transposase [Burkholderia ubonensis]